MFKRLSIRQKQMAIIMATSSAALLLAGAAFIIYEVISFRQAMTGNLSSLGSVIGNNSTAALEFNDPKDAGDILSSLSKEHHVIAACIYDNHGQIFASYLRDKQPFTFPSVAASDSDQFSNSRLEIFRRIEKKKNGARAGAVYICSDASELAIRLRQYFVIVAVVLGASFVVALVLSLGLQRLISEPILQLAAMAKAVSTEKNYALRAPRRGGDEIGALMNGFNEMLEQIQERDAALQSARDHLEKRVQDRTHELEQEVGERRRAEVRLTQQLTRINLLNSITRAMIDRQDLESIVLVVLRQLQDHLPVAFGRLYLYEAGTRRISVAGRILSGATPDPIDLFASTNEIESIGLERCRDGETVLLPQTSVSTAPIAAKLHDSGFESALAVPLIVENGFFGILLTGRKEPNSFSAEESEFLRIVAEQVGLAAHQARLHKELQQAYDELRQTQVAVMQQERLRALGQMASGIAHDINNALCPIVVYSDLLLQESGQFTEGAVRNLKNIKTAGEDIAHIVSRMREFYRRRDTLDAVAPVDLNQIVNQVIDLTRPRWRDIPQAHGIMIEMGPDLEATLPKMAGIDSELREALTNLILNAVDAMPEGGKLIVRTRSAKSEKSSETGGSTHVIVEVTDTGIGMNDETKRRCLEPFFSTKGKRGTGLGLAMVYGVVERHEGKIEIDSVLRRGTTARLVFPIRTARVEAPTAGEPQVPARLPVLHVLCIDDEPLL